MLYNCSHITEIIFIYVFSDSIYIQKYKTILLKLNFRSPIKIQIFHQKSSVKKKSSKQRRLFPHKQITPLIRYLCYMFMLYVYVICLCYIYILTVSLCQYNITWINYRITLGYLLDHFNINRQNTVQPYIVKKYSNK